MNIEEKNPLGYEISMSNCNFDKFTLDDFLEGINIELEHGLVNLETNVTNDDLIMTAKIASAHLNEFPNYYNKDYGLPAFEENLKKAAIGAARYGIQMGFETMETEFMNTVEKAMKYVTLVNSPYLKIYPDSGNLNNAAINYKNDVIEDFELGRGHVVALHMKETVPGKFREIPYGTGNVDFEAFAGKAWDMGVRKFVTEFWYVGNPNWMDDLKAAHSMFEKILDKTVANAK